MQTQCPFSQERDSPPSRWKRSSGSHLLPKKQWPPGDAAAGRGEGENAEKSTSKKTLRKQPGAIPGSRRSPGAGAARGPSRRITVSGLLRSGSLCSRAGLTATLRPCADSLADHCPQHAVVPKSREIALCGRTCSRRSALQLQDRDEPASASPTASAPGPPPPPVLLTYK